jgi:zinc protease
VRWSVLSALLAAAAAACGSGDAPTPALDLTAPLPLPIGLREGALANGLRYEILPARGDGRTQVWLVVGAGSLAEDDDQRGLAHLVEHLAFAGTTHFPGPAVADTLALAGVDWGADLNARTDYDATSYTLTLPADQPAAVFTALDVLRDWASEVTFAPAAIDHERRVVAEEERVRRPTEFAAARRAYELRGSRYATRPPIGDPATVATAPRELLLRFYRDWYQPELMTVIVVGDVDGVAVEAGMRARFGSLRGPTQPRPVPRATVAIRDGDVAITRAATAEAVVIEASQPPPRRTLGDLRGEIIETLRADAVAFAATGTARVPPSTDHFGDVALTISTAAVADTAVARLAAARHGRLSVQAIEVARRAEHDRAVRRLDRVHDTLALALGLVERARNGHVVLDPGQRAADVLALLPTITDAEIATAPSVPTAVFAFVDGTRGAADDAAPIAAKLAAARIAGFRPWPVAPLVEVPQLPAPTGGAGTIVRERLLAANDAPPPSPEGQRLAAQRANTLASMGPDDFLEWTLSNGARVVVRPMATPEHEVAIVGAVAGGVWLAPPGDEVAAQLATETMGRGGAALTAAAFDRAARAAGVIGHGAAISPELSVVYALPATRAETAAALQVIATYMTARAPSDGGSELRARLLARAGKADAERMPLARAVEAALTDDDPASRPLTRGEIMGVDVLRSWAFYRARFGDASAFTFVIVGDVDPAELRAQVDQHLAGLPSTHSPVRSPGPRPRPLHTGPAQVELGGGHHDRADVHLLAWGTSSAGWAERALMQTLLRARLYALLRDEFDDVYAIGVQITAIPGRELMLDIAFSCAPDHAAALTAAARRTLDELRDGAISADEIARALARTRTSYARQLRSPVFWATEFAEAYAMDVFPGRIPADAAHLFRDLADDDVRALAHDVFSLQGVVTGIQRPD